MKRIELDDRIAEGLLALAASRQMSVSECIQAIIAHETESHRSSRPSQADEIDRELETLLFDGPSLPMSFSREGIYATSRPLIQPKATVGGRLPYSQWEKRFDAMLARLPDRPEGTTIDDSRESIYGDDGR